MIFDVQRAGPSTGLPTRTMQGDLSFAYTLSHGDTKHLVLMPATVAEAYEFAMESFDLAERFQTPNTLPRSNGCSGYAQRLGHPRFMPRSRSLSTKTGV